MTLFSLFRSDFRTEDSPTYYGLAPGKACNLKYAFPVRCDGVDTDATGNPTLLHVSIIPADDSIKGICFHLNMPHLGLN